MGSYVRFGAMVGTATVIMFILKYTSVFQLDHIFYSEMRAYMAVMMGSVMAIIMLLFMWKMHKNKKVNYMILIGSAIIFVVTFSLMRSQATVDDVDYMEAMIPHHSIAILTSERASISDPRVEELANQIIETQRKEIAEMKKLIEELEEE